MSNAHDPGTLPYVLSERTTNTIQDCLGPEQAHSHAETTVKMLRTLGRERLVEWIESTFQLGTHNARQLVEDLDLAPNTLTIPHAMNLSGAVFQYTREADSTVISSPSGAARLGSTPGGLFQSLMTPSYDSSPVDSDGTMGHTEIRHLRHDRHTEGLLANTGVALTDQRIPCTRCEKSFKTTKMRRSYYTHLRMNHEIPNDQAKMETEAEYSRAIERVAAAEISPGLNGSGYLGVPGPMITVGQQSEAAMSSDGSSDAGRLQVKLSTSNSPDAYSTVSKRARVDSTLSPPPQLFGGLTFNAYCPVADRLPMGQDIPRSSQLGMRSPNISNAAQQALWSYEAPHPGFFNCTPRTDGTIDTGYQSSFSEGGVLNPEGPTSSSDHIAFRQFYDETHSAQYRH